jgi:hypothetical protein
MHVENAATSIWLHLIGAGLKWALLTSSYAWWWSHTARFSVLVVPCSSWRWRDKPTCFLIYAGKLPDRRTNDMYTLLDRGWSSISVHTRHPGQVSCRARWRAFGSFGLLTVFIRRLGRHLLIGVHSWQMLQFLSNFHQTKNFAIRCVLSGCHLRQLPLASNVEHSVCM